VKLVPGWKPANDTIGINKGVAENVPHDNALHDPDQYQMEKLLDSS